MYCIKCQKESGIASEICPRCGSNIPQQYSYQANAFAFGLYHKPTQIAALTTAANIYVNIDGKQSPMAGASNEVGARAEIEKLLWKFPTLTENDFFRLENPMRENLTEARRILLERILPIGKPAISQDKRNVINLMGIVLDMQTGKDSLIFAKSGTNRMIPRLNMINVPEKLRKDYESFHDYYNATKHANKPVHSALLSEIGSDEGRLITVKYFEYVRRVLEWYYRTQGVSDIPELSLIDYAPYAIVI